MNQRNTMLIERYADHPLKNHLARALTAAERFVERATSINGNRNLSPEGKAAEVKAQVRATLRDIRDSAEPVASMRSKLNALQAGIRIPAFDKSDTSGALARQEIRAALRGMPMGERAAMLVGDDADPRFADAVLEQPATLSGTPAELFKQVHAQRLETLFKPQIAEGEEIDTHIVEAEAALLIARRDVYRSSEMNEVDFNKLADQIAKKRNAPWLKRIGENVVVIPPEGGPAPLATADDLRDGKFYQSFEEYRADRAA